MVVKPAVGCGETTGDPRSAPGAEEHCMAAIGKSARRTAQREVNDFSGGPGAAFTGRRPHRSSPRLSSSCASTSSASSRPPF